ASARGQAIEPKFSTVAAEDPPSVPALPPTDLLRNNTSIVSIWPCLRNVAVFRLVADCHLGGKPWNPHICLHFCLVVLYRSCWAHDAMVWLARTTQREQGGQQTTMVVREACPACGASPSRTMALCLPESSNTHPGPMAANASCTPTTGGWPKNRAPRWNADAVRTSPRTVCGVRWAAGAGG